MFEYIMIYYRRIYGVLYRFFDRLSMRVRPNKGDIESCTDDEVENILVEE
jgi:hypothetical protein